MNISFNFFDSWEQSVDQLWRTPIEMVGYLGYLTFICQCWPKTTTLKNIRKYYMRRQGSILFPAAKFETLVLTLLQLIGGTLIPMFL